MLQGIIIILDNININSVLQVDAVVYVSPLCCHRNLIQCMLVNGRISEWERCERRKDGVQCGDAHSLHMLTVLYKCGYR